MWSRASTLSPPVVTPRYLMAIISVNVLNRHTYRKCFCSVCPHLAFSPRWLCYKHVRYIYPTMHLSPSLESLSKCMFLYSILMMMSRSGTARVTFTLSSSFCCVICTMFIFCSFNSTYCFFLFTSPSVWTKAPSALFLKGILPVSDCMCLMHFGS